MHRTLAGVPSVAGQRKGDPGDVSAACCLPACPRDVLDTSHHLVRPSHHYVRPDPPRQQANSGIVTTAIKEAAWQPEAVIISLVGWVLSLVKG